MFLIPLYVITYYAGNNGVIWAIPVFFSSSLIIKILFRIFKVKFRKMSELVRVLMLSVGLFAFFFSTNHIYFIFACGLLGVVIAVIENETSYQDRLRDNIMEHYLTTSIAGIVGVILVAILSYSYPVNISFSILGVIIITFDLGLTIFKYVKQKRNKANTVA
jgi:chromate transport protein ChrA